MKKSYVRYVPFILFIAMTMFLHLYGHRALAEEPPGGIRLLPGYLSERVSGGIDTRGGKISKQGGLELRYAYGAGDIRIDGLGRTRFSWVKEQDVGELIALIGMGRDDELTISFIRKDHHIGMCDFFGKVKNHEDMAEFLLIALTYPFPRASTTQPLVKPGSQPIGPDTVVSDKWRLPNPGGIRLLPGYEFLPLVVNDRTSMQIAKRGGLKIGCSIGEKVSPVSGDTSPAEVIWKKEQQIGDRHVRVVFSKYGSLGVSVLPQEGKVAANFEAKVASPEDVAEMLLMVLTYPLPPASTTQPGAN